MPYRVEPTLRLIAAVAAAISGAWQAWSRLRGRNGSGN